jgi:hypothetical protein
MFRPRNEKPRAPLIQPVDVQATERSFSSSSTSTCRCSGHGTKFLELLYINLQMFRSRNGVPPALLHQPVATQATQMKFLYLLYISHPVAVMLPCIPSSRLAVLITSMLAVAAGLSTSALGSQILSTGSWWGIQQ